MTDVIN